MKKNADAVANYYSKIQIDTTTPQKKIYLLHARCLDLLIYAKEFDQFERRIFLRKTQNILVQLESALKNNDLVAQSLFFLYDYSYTLLKRGNDYDCDRVYELILTITEPFKKALHIGGCT